MSRIMATGTTHKEVQKALEVARANAHANRKGLKFDGVKMYGSKEKGFKGVQEYSVGDRS